MTEIGKEYGTALFMLACEENAKQEFSNGLNVVTSALRENPDYQEFLSSPGIPLGERISALSAVFAASVPEHLLSYLQLLCEKGRFSCFWDSVEEFNALLEASEHMTTAKVTSAAALTEEEQLKLKNKLELTYHCKVNLECSVDAALLGGLIVEMDGKVMDGSLRHRLRMVKEVIST